MISLQYIVVCNNCETLMQDENPGEDSLGFDPASPVFSHVKPPNYEEYDEGKYVGAYLACPVCKTDSYLMDITEKNKHRVTE